MSLRKLTFNILGGIVLISVSFILVGLALNVLHVTNKPEKPPLCEANASKLLGYINAERVKVGSPVLVQDNGLAITARQKLDDMTTNMYYGHDSLDGHDEFTFFRNYGIRGATWGVDIGGNSSTPLSDWTGYKNSPEHYASLTNPVFTRVGIADMCVNYVARRVTGPSDNRSVIGSTMFQLSVIHLSSPKN